jgi:pimeloyl-ACP methyl ester carboxylesterase
MNKNNLGFVLLPGGGMSSWVWRDLIPHLKKPSVAVDYRLPANTQEARQSATIMDCTDHIINQIERNKLERIILVGHSGAGVLAANTAKAIPEKIHHVVYISANIPKNHETVIDAVPFLLRALNRKIIRSQVKRESTPAKKAEKIIRKHFCNTCPEDIIRYVLAQDLLSEPLCVAFEKINWDNFPDIKQTYVILLKDTSMSVAKQKQMMSHLVVTDSVEIDSDHMVMLSHPRELAQVLNGVI